MMRPPGTPRLIRKVLLRATRSRIGRRVEFRWRWGEPGRLQPLSAEWGLDRGCAVDRWYIRRFLERHAAAVGGTVLEVKEDLYASALGAGRVEILDIDPANRAATIVGDLCDRRTLGSCRFDAAVVTQTLQLVADPAAALSNVLESLLPGGTLLLTVPTTSKLAGPADRWRWTELGLRELCEAVGAEGEVRAHGNLLACRAFLLGAAVEDLRSHLLEHDDPEFPLIVTAVLRKP